MSLIRVPKSIRDFGGWGAVAIEIAIVTVGILVAFSLDSWWEGRQQRARKIVHQSASSGIRRNRQRTRLDLMGALARVFTAHQFEPITAAYDAMIARRTVESRAALS